MAYLVEYVAWNYRIGGGDSGQPIIFVAKTKARGVALWNW
jgi:hypothetical protein